MQEQNERGVGFYGVNLRSIAASCGHRPVRPRRRKSHKPVLVYFLYQMDFEFDPAKSAANLKKHGIDFVGAQVLWSDPDRLEIPARALDEPRAQVLGRIGEVVWSAFITMRNNRIRIISVRRARDEEQAAYLQD